MSLVHTSMPFGPASIPPGKLVSAQRGWGCAGTCNQPDGDDAGHLLIRARGQLLRAGWPSLCSCPVLARFFALGASMAYAAYFTHFVWVPDVAAADWMVKS
eukprot:scaffold98349_cov18-Tisochrysis_lutea.AAC.1